MTPLFFIILFIALFTIFAYFLFTLEVNLLEKRILEALKLKYAITVYSLSKTFLAKFVNKEIIRKCIDFLFFSAHFEEYLELLRYHNVLDNKYWFISKEADMLALDIETDLELEKEEPREIGLVAISSSKWKELSSIRLDNFSKYKDTYGVEVKYFLQTLLRLRNFKVMIGHNIYFFDKPILEEWGIDFSSLSFIDTLFLSVTILPEFPSHSLEFVSDYFNVTYTPHLADEDAKASFRVFTYLLVFAKEREILDELKQVNFKAIEGLNFLKVLPPVFQESVTSYQTRYANKGELIITPDASAYGNAWYPKAINLKKLNEVKPSSVYEKLALITIKSFVTSNVRNIEILEKIFTPSLEHAVALKSILKEVVEECNRIDSEGVAVEYTHLREFMEKANTRKWKKVYFKGASILKAFFPTDSEVILSWFRERAEEIVLETIFVDEFKDYKVVIPSVEKKLFLTSKGKDKSFRHFQFLTSLAASIIHEHSKKVAFFTVNNFEKFLLKQIVLATKSKVIELKEDYNPLDTIKLVSRISRSGYALMIFSMRTFVRSSLEATLLKPLVDVTFATNSKLFIVNCDSETLNKLGLLNFTEEVNPKNMLKVPLKAQFLLFQSVDDALKAAEEIVSNVWNFKLRSYQKECIAKLLTPYTQDYIAYKLPVTIVILPTGSGKSLVFQSISLLLRQKIGGTTIVVSPLLALIEDQVESLKRRGIKVCKITGQERGNLYSLLRSIELGYFSIVYLTPEQLEKESVRRSLEKTDINYVVLDEVHTVWKWGKTFRPSYSFIASYLKRRRDEGFWFPIVGFTATLPSEGIEEVFEMLTGKRDYKLEEIALEDNSTHSRNNVPGNKGYPQPLELLEPNPERYVLKGPILRSNLLIDVNEVPIISERPDLLLKAVQELITWAEETSKKPWVGVVFVPFVKSSKEQENASFLAKYLKIKLGEEVLCFHGQLNDTEKRKVLQAIYSVSKGEKKRPRILITTKAFGMGVDIVNIRWIVHYMLPESIEDYYQEIGRGGRDGLPCKTVLLFGLHYDYRRMLALMRHNFVDPNFVTAIYWKLRKSDEELISLRSLLLSHEEPSEERIRRVERALNILSNIGLLSYDLVSESKGVLHARILLLNKSVNIKDVFSAITKERASAMLSLRMMRRFAEELLKTEPKNRQIVAAKLLEDYFSKSIDKLYREAIEEKQSKVEKTLTKYEKTYFNLIENGYVIKRVNKIDKMNLARQIAELSMLHIVKTKTFPPYVAVMIPHGYRKYVWQNIVKMYEEFDFLPLYPTVHAASKKRRLYEYNIKLSSVNCVFVLVTNSYMKQVANTLSAHNVYRLYVRRYAK
ncbi:MAG: DEAD/DEAH box helicase [Thermoproteota archaeon]